MIPLTRPIFGSEESEAVARVLADGLAPGQPEVVALERDLADAFRAEQAVAVSSGTAALHLALVAAGIRPGDEVVVPSLSGIAAANAVRNVGGRVRFVDVDPLTLAVPAADLERVLTPGTKAVVVVHQAGAAVDASEVRARCAPLGIAVIEDGASAIGSTLHGRPVGSHPGTVALSLGRESVVTCGEGGVLTVADADVAGRVRRLRNHGSLPWPGDGPRQSPGSDLLPGHREVGWSYRLSDIGAAIARVQLRRLPLVLHRRRWLAEQYRRGLVDHLGLEAAGDPPHGTTNFQSFWLVVPERSPVGRDELIGVLRANGITSRRGFVAAHRELAYRHEPHAALPVTERLAARSLFLPLFHDLDERDVERIVDVVGDTLVVSSRAG